MTKAVLPGATIGVLGSGQLGRMFAIAARKMGYRVHTFSPDDDTPTGQVADLEHVASYDDLDRVRAFAREVDMVTFEFENVPAETAQAAAELAPVRPDGRILHIAQNRLREKNFLRDAGFPVARFREVTTDSELKDAVEEVGLPAVLKTAGWGYDGKGQHRVGNAEDAQNAWQSTGGHAAVLEEFVEFEREASVVVARGLDGEMADFGVIENRHENHILDVSVAPAALSAELKEHAIDIARQVAEKLELVGVLCVELFIGQDGNVLINELAPRPHNSGHLTFDACVTCQFEQQLRAVCGLPLGSTEHLRPSAMANLLGDLWANGEPNWAAACHVPQVKLHLYGKREARPGRKMGHLTALADSAEQAREAVLLARSALTGR